MCIFSIFRLNESWDYTNTNLYALKYQAQYKAYRKNAVNMNVNSSKINL